MPSRGRRPSWSGMNPSLAHVTIPPMHGLSLSAWSRAANRPERHHPHPPSASAPHPPSASAPTPTKCLNTHTHQVPQHPHPPSASAPTPTECLSTHTHRAPQHRPPAHDGAPHPKGELPCLLRPLHGLGRGVGRGRGWVGAAHCWRTCVRLLELGWLALLRCLLGWKHAPRHRCAAVHAHAHVHAPIRTQTHRGSSTVPPTHLRRH